MPQSTPCTMEAPSRRRLSAISTQLQLEPSAGVLKWLSGLLGGGGGGAEAEPESALLFVGCYTDATPFLFGTPGGGILSFKVDLATGALSPLAGYEPCPAGTNPTSASHAADPLERKVLGCHQVGRCECT